MNKKYIGYFVPHFPVSKVTDNGKDGWIDMPCHPKSKYRFLDAILEHIDNTNYIDPVRITIHDENQVQVGPSGTSRFYALTHIRNYTHIPALVSTTKYFDWFGDDIIKIEDKEQIKSYLLLEPVTYNIDFDGKIWWHNENPNENQIRSTFKVSDETIKRILKCI